jgi:hypothetical protein
VEAVDGKRIARREAEHGARAKARFENFQNKIQILLNFETQNEGFLISKDTQAFHVPRFKNYEQLSQLRRPQILNRIHVINSETDSNLNLL